MKSNLAWLPLVALIASACGPSRSDAGGPTGPYEDPTLIVSGQNRPTALVYDAGKLYFLTEIPMGHALSVVSAEGGAVETLAPNAGPFALREQTLYFYDGDTALLKLPVTGGAASPVFADSVDTVTSVAVDASGVYWTSHDSEFYGRVEALMQGSSAPIWVTSVHTDPTHLVLDDASAYFEAAGLILRVEKKQDGAELQLATSTAEALAVDEESVYWATIHPSSVRSVPKSGGEPAVLRANLDHPRDVALDATHVYFTSAALGRVGRVRKDGSKPEWLAIDQEVPYDLALSDDRVFWGNTKSGTIASVHK